MKRALSVVLALVMSCPPEVVHADPLDWINGTWSVRYDDRALGSVSGYAIVSGSDSNRRVNVTLRHPRTQALSQLRSVSVALDRGQIRMKLIGENPSDVELVSSVEQPGPGQLAIPGQTTVRARLGQKNAEIQTGVEPGREHEIQLVGTVSEDKRSIAWSWSFPYPGDNPGLLARRTGTFSADRRVVTGTENWTRGSLRIAKTELAGLDYRSLRERRDADATAVRIAMAGWGEDIGTAFWLVIEGWDLPITEADPVALDFNDGDLGYLGKKKGRRVDNTNGRDRLELLVGVSRSIEPGIKTFRLNGESASFLLSLPGPGDEVQIEAWYGGPYRTTDAPQFEATEAVAEKQPFRVALIYPAEPFFDARFVDVWVNGRRNGPYALERSEGNPRRFDMDDRLAIGSAPTDDVEPQEDEPTEWIAARPRDRIEIRWSESTSLRSDSLAAADVTLAPARVPQLIVSNAADPESNESVASLTAHTPFTLQVRMPRAQADQIGEQLNVVLKNERNQKHQEIELVRQPNTRNPTVTYLLPIQDYIADRNLYYNLTLQRDVASLSIENGDVIIFSYGNVRVRIAAYDTQTQEDLARVRANLRVARDVYVGLLNHYDDIQRESENFFGQNQSTLNRLGRAVPKLNTSVDKLTLERLKKLAEHGLALSENPNMTDPARLTFALAYLGTLQRSSYVAGWRAASSNTPVHGVVPVAMEERELLANVTREAENARADRFMRLTSESVIAGYEMVTAFTGTAQFMQVFLEQDVFGRPVDGYERFMAGIQLAEMLVLVKVMLNARRDMAIRVGGSTTEFPTASPSVETTLPEVEVPPRLRAAASRVRTANRLRGPQWRTREEAEASLVSQRDAHRAVESRRYGLDTVDAVENDVLSGVDAAHQPAVRQTLRSLVADAQARETLLRTPGSEDGVGDIAAGGNKEIGARYAFRKMGEYVNEGGSFRRLEDRMPGLPKYETTTGRTSSLQASDGVTTHGDVMQFKSYSDWSKAFASVKDQIVSDFTRYADQGWRDGTMSTLSGRFEYHIDARVRGGATARRTASADAYAREATAWARSTFRVPDGVRLEIKIYID